MTDAAKQRFAVAFVRDPTDAWAAAAAAWPHDTRWKLWSYHNLPTDPEVLAFLAAVRAVTDRDELELPSVHEYALSVWKLAQSTLDEKLQRDYMRLYGEIRGYLKRPQGDGDGSVNITHNKVMVVKKYGTDEAWELGARTQQAALLEDLQNISEAVAVDAPAE